MSNNDYEDDIDADEMPMFGMVPLGPVFEEYKDAHSEIREYDPIELAICFSALLTEPSLQSNCIRLETLVYLSLAIGTGEKKPDEAIISKLFATFNEGSVGLFEDPSEDVFVSLIITPRGNYRLLEGIWTSGGFYTQALLNTLEMLPRIPNLDRLRDIVYSLLKLSDMLCERAGLASHILGEEIPQKQIPIEVLNATIERSCALSFTREELKENGLSLELLQQYFFNGKERAQFSNEKIGHSTLERFPLLYWKGEVLFLLPTATSAALRRYVLDVFSDPQTTDNFAHALADQYADAFRNSPLLGGKKEIPLRFQRTENGLLTAGMIAADRGLYINVVLFSDTLKDFDDGGLVGAFPKNNGEGLAENLNYLIDCAYEDARKQKGFKSGITLAVACGIGRGVLQFWQEKNRANWRVEFISEADLLTLNWLPDFEPISLFRLYQSQDRLQELGVGLHNINGLLNIVGWARSLGGHLVPHGSMPFEFGDNDRPAFVVVDQNALRAVRHEVASKWDAKGILDVEGRWIRVRRTNQSMFEDDLNRPLYFSDNNPGTRWPLIVYETNKRAWWLELQTTEDTTAHFARERSGTLHTWLCRAAAILDDEFPTLPDGPILWRVAFEGNIGNVSGHGPETLFTVEQAIKEITVEATGTIIKFDISENYEMAFVHPENVAERALVCCLIEGASKLSGRAIAVEDYERIVNAIIPNVHARYTHMLQARHFRDFVRSSVGSKPITIDTDDAAYIKLGMGWKVRNRSDGGDIRGAKECTTYLNSMVAMLEDELCAELRKYDREKVIQFTLRNHESAANDRDTWRRTSAAVVALQTNRQKALQTIFEHEFELNAVFTSTRILTEFAICECPLQGGEIPGQLTLSRIMARIMMLIGFGGWSDAIHWEAMEARIVVTPLGDIQANQSFQEEVLVPFGRASTEVTVQNNIDSYSENYDEPEVIKTDESAFPKEFWDAYEEEYGTSFDDVRKFADLLENLGLEHNSAVFSIKKSELLVARLNEIEPDIDGKESLIDRLTFKPRPSWRVVPSGFLDKDRFPWRFRRRLSLLRRPIVQIDNADDPTLLITPGIVRDSLHYMLRNYHDGSFPLVQLGPKMRKWAGIAIAAKGTSFANEVSERMRELGWRTQPEIKVTQLLGKSFDRDYGDVDVLAWQPESGRVLLIECKDVQYRKIDGEIAEQLSDFRGEINSDGKRDELLRHLDRVQIIQQNVPAIMKYLKLKSSPNLEAHLVFKNPVPMKFAWARMEKKIRLSIFSELDALNER